VTLVSLYSIMLWLFEENVSDLCHWEAHAVVKRKLSRTECRHRPALSAGTMVSLTGNCTKQKPQID